MNRALSQLISDYFYETSVEAPPFPSHFAYRLVTGSSPAGLLLQFSLFGFEAPIEE
jgi:hypothetical protein